MKGKQFYWWRLLKNLEMQEAYQLIEAKKYTLRKLETKLEKSCGELFDWMRELQTSDIHCSYQRIAHVQNI